MDKENVSQDELNAEAEALKDVSEEEVRTKIVTELGISEDDNPDLVEKLVKRELEHRTNLSKAIGQKIKYRDAANGKPDTSKSPSKVNMTPDEIAEQARKAAREEFENRDLNEMGHSDTIKEQIKRIAQIQNVSVRQAEKDPYIQSLIENESRQKSVDDAAKNGARRAKTGVTIDVSKPLDPSQFDLSTEEGRKEWEEAKQARRKAVEGN